MYLNDLDNAMADLKQLAKTLPKGEDRDLVTAILNDVKRGKDVALKEIEDLQSIIAAHNSERHAVDEAYLRPLYDDDD